MVERPFDSPTKRPLPVVPLSSSPYRCLPGGACSHQVIQMPLQLLHQVLLQRLLHAAAAAATATACAV